MNDIESEEALRQLAAILREQLESAGYSHDELYSLLGTDDLEGPREALYRERMKGRTEPLAVLTRLFLLVDEVPEAEVAEALPEEPRRLLCEWGILESASADALRSTVRITPFAGSHVCSDRGRAEAGAATESPEGPMSGPSMATGILLQALPPDHRRRVLDLGSGVGSLTLSAARSSDTVVGLELSDRGLQLTRLNIALNEADNVRLIRGDMTRVPFGPSFDLVICNPPFVASLGQGLMWTAGGPLGEALLTPVLRQLEQLLVPGGEARILCNLALRKGEEVEDKLQALFGDGRMAAFDLVAVESTPRDPEEYALQHGLTRTDGRIEADAARAARLLDHFESEGINRMVLTLLALRRVSDGSGRFFAHRARPLQVGSAYFEQVFDLWGMLREGGRKSLLKARAKLVDGLTIRQPFPPEERESAEIHPPADQPWRPEHLGNDLLTLATLLDGERTGREVCQVLEGADVPPMLARRLVVKGTEMLIVKGLATLT